MTKERPESAKGVSNMTPVEQRAFIFNSRVITLSSREWVNLCWQTYFKFQKGWTIALVKGVLASFVGDEEKTNYIRGLLYQEEVLRQQEEKKKRPVAMAPSEKFQSRGDAEWYFFERR